VVAAEATDQLVQPIKEAKAILVVQAVPRQAEAQMVLVAAAEPAGLDRQAAILQLLTMVELV
jgi:hypothetical protein